MLMITTNLPSHYNDNNQNDLFVYLFDRLNFMNAAIPEHHLGSIFLLWCNRVRCREPMQLLGREGQLSLWRSSALPGDSLGLWKKQ